MMAASKLVLEIETLDELDPFATLSIVPPLTLIVMSLVAPSTTRPVLVPTVLMRLPPTIPETVPLFIFTVTFPTLDVA